jgi:hypothetical protein
VAALIARVAAKRGPIALVIENVQWLDAQSWALLLHLRAAAALASALCIVATARPSPALVARYATLVGEAPSVRVQLRGLDAAAVAALCAARLGVAAVPEALAREVLRVTDGNPLFVYEVVAAAAGDAKPRARSPAGDANGEAIGGSGGGGGGGGGGGVDDGAGGSGREGFNNRLFDLRAIAPPGESAPHTPRGGASASPPRAHLDARTEAEILRRLAVTSSMEQLLLSRLDALPPAEQELVKAAAAVGPEFDLAVLQEVCAQRTEQVRPPVPLSVISSRLSPTPRSSPAPCGGWPSTASWPWRTRLRDARAAALCTRRCKRWPTRC